MRTGKLILVVVALVGLALVFASPVAAKKWKAGGVAPANTLDDDTLKMWCELVEKKTGGK